MKIISKVIRKICTFMKIRKISTWEKIEYFNPEWKKRIQIMSQYIGANDSVVDLGCGQNWLKEFLTPANQYYGVDYRKRNDETIICNFNDHEYPNLSADVYFISGTLEYVKDYDCFIDNIVNFCQRCIISYCCIEDFPDKGMRGQRAWVNNLTRSQLVGAFARNGMKLTFEDKTLTNNSIFIFDTSSN